MEFNNIFEKMVKIGDIPALILTPKNYSELHPTVIFYHGWGSSIEKQRFRGFILCSLGYQVIIPCSIYHGDRNPIDHSKPDNAGKYFWTVILKNIEESNLIIEYAIDYQYADPNRIGVSGNSMGGFSSAGIFTSNQKIKTLVVLNGSCNWEYSNKLFMEGLNITNNNSSNELQENIDRYDPMKNLEDIINRPILLLHGDNDTLVSIDAQRLFYNNVFPLWKDTGRIEFIEYAKLNHFVTTNMMEEAAMWFNKYL